MQAVFYRSWPVAWLTCGRRRSGSVQRPVWAAGVSGICGGLGGGEHPARCPDGGSRIGDSRGGLGAGVAGVVVEGDHAIDLATQGGTIGARGVPDVLRSRDSDQNPVGSGSGFYLVTVGMG